MIISCLHLHHFNKLFFAVVVVVVVVADDVVDATHRTLKWFLFNCLFFLLKFKYSVQFYTVVYCRVYVDVDFMKIILKI